VNGPPVLIAGVGRSGTTAAFELLHGWLGASGRLGATCNEPSVWDSAALFRDGALNPDAFTTQAYSARGILTHVETPLFLTGPDAAHDEFVRGLVPDGGGLVKMIRACGRLESWSRLHPGAKIVGVVRNPFDSLNSAHLHFSLLGDEFHVSDKRRLGAEIAARFGETPELPGSPDDKEHAWAGYWWLYMNRALIEHRAAAPDNVFLLPYELLLENEAVARDRLAGFLGLDPADAPVVTEGRKRTGVTSKANRVLIEEEVEFLKDFQRWYEDFLLGPLETDGLVSDRYRLAGVLDHYGETTGQSLLRKYPTWRTSVTWRFVHDGRKGEKRADVAARLVEAETALETLARGAAAPRRDASAQVSVIVSLYDETPDAIDRAVGALLTQSLPPAEIILAEDRGPQPTAEHAEALAARHARVRHLRQPANIGPGANRHVATLAASGDWVAHLDADDIWLPDKLEAEWDALQGADDPGVAVAMSDVEVFEDGEYDHSWTMADLAGLPKYHQIGYLFRRDGPIPRDMLMAKALYRAAGGFETYARMYEDWAFKLRLARLSGEWRATGRTGVVYHRSADAGLSAGDTMAHLYWRWFALCRSAEIEPDYEPLLRDGLWQAAELLPAHEWLRKLLHIALSRAVKSGSPHGRVRDAAGRFLARADLDRPARNYAEELEAFAHDLIGRDGRRAGTRKLKLVRTK